MADPLFLLDTNILVYLVDGGFPPLNERVTSFRKGQLVTSALCLAEAMAGERTADELAVLLRLSERIPALPFDDNAARTFRAIPFKRRRIDRFIAAQAVSLGLAIVTNNEADFRDIEGLAIENWTLPL